VTRPGRHTDARRSWLEVDGTALETSELPGIGGPPLVFLHEGLGCVEMWRAFPAAVHAAVGRPRALVYSRAGYGRSGPARLPRQVTYMHHEAEVVLPALVAATGIERPLLVGHSDGASIALLHAGAGHAASGLVLLAPHVFVEDVTVASIAAARDAYVATDLRTRLGRYHDDVDATFRGWNDVWLSPAFRAWDITDRLPAIDVPVLVVQGADDAFGTGRQLDAIAAGVRGPCTRVVVDGVGHAPHLEAPDVTLDAITAFATRLGPSR
jgi:pimeloyl-ACP methyl ester carboxylesterase